MQEYLESTCELHTKEFFLQNSYGVFLGFTLQIMALGRAYECLDFHLIAPSFQPHAIHGLVQGHHLLYQRMPLTILLILLYPGYSVQPPESVSRMWIVASFQGMAMSSTCCQRIR